ncbi:hypothetical protein CHARACLAT_027278 [Characodon lateralis]|uniref:B30.2/SPRY domain-containing protein n=1 Tax=Characodon lateralis TaxID=208331 RepID=A0ABU7DK75_9TELE|nr:hypothetical protein [Characodon lateralis]
MDPTGVQRLIKDLRKYSCQLTFDLNSVHRNLKLSDNSRKVTHTNRFQSYLDHPERFGGWWPQLLCTNGLTGRCYWEVEWSGVVYVSVSYRGIKRRGFRDCVFGWNDQSWSLKCCDVGGYSVWHHNKGKPTASSDTDSVSNRVAVYVDCPAGILSFYRVSGSLIHLHTFNTTFTEPLYPGFGFWFPGSSVSLCSGGKPQAMVMHIDFPSSVDAVRPTVSRQEVRVSILQTLKFDLFKDDTKLPVNMRAKLRGEITISKITGISLVLVLVVFRLSGTGSRGQQTQQTSLSPDTSSSSSRGSPRRSQAS